MTSGTRSLRFVGLAGLVSMASVFAAAAGTKLPNTGIVIDKASHEAGRLVIKGSTPAPSQLVVLDGPKASRRSDARRAFTFSTTLIPGDCEVVLKVGLKTDRLRIAACGPPGPKGATGAMGPAGAKGSDGMAGAVGPTGASAYEIARAADPDIGTEDEWLATLVGPAGPAGPQGLPGPDGNDGLGFRLRGGFDAAHAGPGDQEPYERNDVVTFAGEPYALNADAASTADTPDVLADWVKLANKGADGAAGPQGPQGLQGPPGPTGTPGIISAARKAQNIGGSLQNTSGVYQFIGAPLSVTTVGSQAVMVHAQAALGTTAAVGATLSNLDICWQAPGGTINDDGGYLQNIKIGPNQRLPVSLSQLVSLPSPGTWLVGMCYVAADANMNSNDWYRTTAFVVGAAIN